MIQTFSDKHTESLYEGECHAKFRNFRKLAERKLQMLESATDIADLRQPPGNHLKKLHGDRGDSWSIRINKQWRICFLFDAGHAYDVEIVDYH